MADRENQEFSVQNTHEKLIAYYQMTVRTVITYHADCMLCQFRSDQLQSFISEYGDVCPHCSAISVNYRLRSTLTPPINFKPIQALALITVALPIEKLNRTR